MTDAWAATEPQPQQAAAFVRENTRLLSPPLVPEIRLHLAEESLPIWAKTEEELEAHGLPPPFWSFAWAGGQALARYLLDHPELVVGRSVLDLGAGSGLVAIAAMKCGARGALAAEIDAFGRAAIALNAAENDVTVGISGSDVLDGTPAADLVLIGDLFYERGLAERVLAVIAQVRHAGADVLVGDPKRTYFPLDQFERIAEYYVPVTRELEDVEIKHSAVWRPL
jgi:predicted nicotinamide N-methyase